MPTCVVLSMRGTETLAEEVQFVDQPGFINDFIPDPTFLGSWDDSRIVLMGPSSPDETLPPFPPKASRRAEGRRGTFAGPSSFSESGKPSRRSTLRWRTTAPWSSFEAPQFF